jgi:hypothetical protein
MSDQKKRRLPQFEEIVALSHQPPRKTAVSPFTVAYDAETQRKQEGLQKIRPTDVVIPPAPPVEISPSGGTTVVPSYHAPDTTATTAIRGTTATTDRVDAASRAAWSRPNLEQLNLKIPRQFAEKFRMWCFMNRMSMAQAFVRSAQSLMDSGGTTNGGSGGTTATTLLIDDLMTDDIINREVVSLYEELTGNKFTDADRRFLEEIKNIPPDRQKIGIALSVARAKNKINSFRYCFGAIQEAAESTSDLTGYLEYVRSKIARKQQRTT